MTDHFQALDNPIPSDSGYGSIASSPNENNSKIRSDSHDTSVQHSQPPPKPVSSSILQGLQRFEKDVDQATLDRFKDVVERVQNPLVDYMRKKYKARDFQTMAIRLMVIGTTYDDAKPHIVVLCSKDKTKRVKKFFAQRLIVAICRSNDESQISFEVTVVGQAPRLKYGDSTIEVYGASTYSTSVGWATSSTLIKITGEDGDRYATMGGIIKIVKPDNDIILCGLTAGHILDESDQMGSYDDGPSTKDLLSCAEVSSDDEDDSDEEILYADRTVSRPNNLQNISLPANIKIGTSWSRVGTITAKGRSIDARNRDWALVEEISKPFQRTNMIQKRHEDFAQEPVRCLTLVKEKSIGEAFKHRVLILASGSVHGCCSQSGLLSSLPTMTLFPSGTKFIPVYTVALDNDSVLVNGSSGSWVMDERSCEIYGHVVADDPFGDVFVVPFTDILDDIKRAVGAKEVTLPSDIDILSHLSKDTSQGLRKGKSLTSEPQSALMMARSLLNPPFPQTKTGNKSVMPRADPGLGSWLSAPTPHPTDRAGTPKPASIRTSTVDSQESHSFGAISPNMLSSTATFSRKARSATFLKKSFFSAFTTRMRQGQSQSRSRANVSHERSKSPMILPPEHLPSTSSAQPAITMILPPKHLPPTSSAQPAISPTHASSESKQSRHDSAQSAQSLSKSDPWRGRHSNSWLFNDFSVTDTAKDMFRRKS